MDQAVIQISGGITINVDVTLKTSHMWKRLCYLLHGIAKMENIKQVFWMIQRLSTRQLRT